MWIKKYDELLFKTPNNAKATIEATLLKNANMPDIVYKYREPNDSHIDALSQNILYASSPSRLNDPCEGALYVDTEKRWKFHYQALLEVIYMEAGHRLAISLDDFSDKEQFILELAKCLGIYDHELKSWKFLCEFGDNTAEVVHRKFEKELNEGNEELHRVCSFSTVNESHPMWVHYSTDFSGFCVGYNIKELRNDLTDLLLPVRYTDELLEVDDTFFSKGKPNNSFYIDSLTRKSTQWQYEQEWRLLLLAQSEELSQCIEMPTPKEIILGKKIKIEDAKKILSIGERLGANCYKQTLSKTSYAIELTRITSKDLSYYFA